MLNLHLHLLNKVTCKSQNQRHIDIKNDQEFKKIIRQTFKINNPNIRAVAEKNPKIHFNTFEDILNSDYHAFKISEKFSVMGIILFIIIPLLIGVLVYKIIY